MNYRSAFLLFAILCGGCLLLQYRFSYVSISRCFSQKGYVATRVVERVYFDIEPTTSASIAQTREISTRKTGSPTRPSTEPPTQRPRCEPQNYVVFLKTHKTGSSTITNILNRYADWNNLTMLLPNDKQFYSFNWPNKFRLSYAKDNHGVMPNILANHARYSRKSMNVLFPRKRTSYITILREPVKQWESTFSYMSFPYILNIYKMKDPLNFFLNHPPSIQNIQKNARRFPSIHLIKNPLFFDLGLDYKYYDNITMIRRALKTIEKDFDIVLMMEHFDESMVLLKRRLCWSIDDVVFFKTNERLNKNKRRVLTAEEENLIKKWNTADVALYNYFVDKFWKEIEKEGSDFYDDLQELKERKKYYFNACVEKEAVTEAYTSVFVKGYEMRKNLTGDLKIFCKRMLRNELAYQDYFKDQYASRVMALEGDTIENFDDQFEEVDVDIESGSTWGEEGHAYSYGLPPKQPKAAAKNVQQSKADVNDGSSIKQNNPTQATVESPVKDNANKALTKETATVAKDEKVQSTRLKSVDSKNENSDKLKENEINPTTSKSVTLSNKVRPTNSQTLEVIRKKKLTTLAKHMNELESVVTTLPNDNRPELTTEEVILKTTAITGVISKKRKEALTKTHTQNKVKTSPLLKSTKGSYTRFESSAKKALPVESANKVLDMDDPKRYDGKSIIK
ncbi:galactosylceramide sulfotransferase-like [Rhopilema esculentum]|uniref:galactosylceramide sulfotransferase-like n=1 Tax=Rhopilema esculentum TaxID=499914 RepID=UPI0031D0D981